MAKKGYIWYDVHGKKWAVGYLVDIVDNDAMYYTAHEVDTWDEALSQLIEDQVTAS